MGIIDLSRVHAALLIATDDGRRLTVPLNDLAMRGAGGGMNDTNNNDDDGARRWVEAQCSMYGRCAVGTEDKEELRAIDKDGIAIDVIVAAAAARRLSPPPAAALMSNISFFLVDLAMVVSSSIGCDRWPA